MENASVPVPVSFPEGEKPKTKQTRNKYLDSVYLSEDECRKLQESMDQKTLDIGIEQLDYSITVKGGKYKDHYKTLLNWFRRGFLNFDGGGKHGNARRKAGSGENSELNYPVDIEG